MVKSTHRGGHAGAHPPGETLVTHFPKLRESPSTLQAINRAMQKPQEEYSIGVLDIYGFEIFQVRPLFPSPHQVPP